MPSKPAATGPTGVLLAMFRRAAASPGSVMLTSFFCNGLPPRAMPASCPPGRLRPYTVYLAVLPGLPTGGTMKSMYGRCETVRR